jgi:predicted DsbA family dithiol-disulfide isomerase
MLLALLSACSAEKRDADADDAEVIAILDGEPILRGEVSAPAAFRIYRHQVDIYSLLKSQTEKLVDERLLAREAERRGVSVDELIAGVESASRPVIEAEIDRYLAEHPRESAVPSEEVRARVRHYLEQTRRIDERLAFVATLRERAGFEWRLEPPEQPRVRVDVAGAPARGDAAAAVTLVHFASFGSPQSAQSARRIAQLREEFPGALRQVHRNHLDRADEPSLLATRVGFLAQDAGRFWEFHDALLAGAVPLDEAAIARAARGVGLPADTIERARADTELLERVRRDMAASTAAGVPRAPTIFANGRYLSGLVPYEELRALVADELARGKNPTR